MAQSEPLSINGVAKKLRLSVHQLRRWELLFGLEVKRGKGQQRQYRAQDLSVLERIKELVNQGWPTLQICQQLQTEGLTAPKLIGLPSPSQSSEALAESIISVRSFCERRLAEIAQQLNEIQQILISLSLKQQVADSTYSPWQPVNTSFSGLVRETYVDPSQVHELPGSGSDATAQQGEVVSIAQEGATMPEITDQNYLTVLGKTLDLVGWSDEQADEYSMKNYGVPVWIDLGRSDAERFIEYLRSLFSAETIATSTSTIPSSSLVAETIAAPSVYGVESSSLAAG